MHWAMWDAMFKAQGAMEGMLSNFPNRFVAAAMRRIVFPIGRPYVVPSDRLGQKVARLLITPSDTRDRLTAGIYISRVPDNPVALLERALAATVAAEPIEAKLRAAAKDGRFDAKLPPGSGVDALVARAQAAGVITAAEGTVIVAARELTEKVIRVDDFPQDLGASEMRLETSLAPSAGAQPIVHKAAA
jgi:acyl-CoA dehydrogenase